MFGNRPLVFTMSVGMLSMMQASVAQSNHVTLNFDTTSEYILVQHPYDASEWICIVGVTREIQCARYSNYYDEVIDFIYTDDTTYQFIKAEYN